MAYFDSNAEFNIYRIDFIKKITRNLKFYEKGPGTQGGGKSLKKSH